MTLLALALVALEHVVLVLWSQAVFTRDVGAKGNAGPRDDLPPVSALTGRLKRALANHIENWPLFLTAVVMVHLTDSTGPLTGALALTYAAARALYIPAYAFGWSPWRSVIYMIGLLASCAMILASLL